MVLALLVRTMRPDWVSSVLRNITGEGASCPAWPSHQLYSPAWGGLIGWFGPVDQARLRRAVQETGPSQKGVPNGKTAPESGRTQNLLASVPTDAGEESYLDTRDASNETALRPCASATGRQVTCPRWI